MKTIRNKILKDVIIIVAFLIAIVTSAIAKKPFSANAYGLGIGMGWLVRDVSDYSLMKRVEKQFDELVLQIKEVEEKEDGEE